MSESLMPSLLPPRLLLLSVACVASVGAQDAGSGALVDADTDGSSSMMLWYSVVVDFFVQNAGAPFLAFWPALIDHLFSLAGLWFWIIVLLICCFIPYVCFQSHLLPHWAGQIVGRLYFRPCLPCTIYGNKKAFKGQWWAYIDEADPPILLGQAPLFESQLRELETLGVKAIVNLQDEWKGHAGSYRKQGVSLLWLRTVDHLEPTVEAMRTACSFIEHHRKRGSGVYIHCKSGRGRSAAIAMAWLMQVKKMKPLEANMHLLTQRPGVRAKLFLQKNVIQFYEDLSNKPPASGDDAEAGRSNLSYATPWTQTNRRNSTTAQRDMLQGGGATAPSGPGANGNGRGGAGFLRNLSFRPAAAGGMRRLSMMTTPQFACGSAAPDWEQDPASGVWEINVAPLQPSIPEQLPPWAQQQQQQYENKYRQPGYNTQPGYGRVPEQEAAARGAAPPRGFQPSAGGFQQPGGGFQQPGGGFQQPGGGFQQPGGSGVQPFQPQANPFQRGASANNMGRPAFQQTAAALPSASQQRSAAYGDGSRPPMFVTAQL